MSRPLRLVINPARAQCRSHTTAARPPRFAPVQLLSDASLETFRRDVFEPAVPALLPRRAFADLVARKKWFVKSETDGWSLNAEYLGRYGDSVVPLEILTKEDGQEDGCERFERVEMPLRVFLEASTLPTTPQQPQIYLAQYPIPSLPQPLQDDLPAPSLVTSAGKGDIYASSIWLGRAPTYTPLHRDPNPNLFVQLAGNKVVRLMKPSHGDRVFTAVRERVASGGRGVGGGRLRGEEMMQGEEREVLEEEVWGEGGSAAGGWEAELEGGDGLFIPKGWWHSVRGVGSGMTGSVNWWFR